MESAELLVQIYTVLLASTEKEERDSAEKQLMDLKNNHVGDFLQMNLFIMQNPDKLPPEILRSSLVYCRSSFKKATKVKKAEDQTEEYLLIPPEVANGMIPVIFPLCGNENLSYLASQLLGQIAVYILSWEPENEIFSLICQQIADPSTSLSSCHAMIYILQETEIAPPFQAMLFQSIIPLLADANVPLQIKSQIVLVIDSMVTELPELISDPAEFAKFAASMLALTEASELKSASYEFWEDVASNIPDTIATVPDIFQLCFNDLQQLKQTSEDDEMNLLMTIIRFLTHLIKPEFEESDPLLPILAQAIPSFIPVLLEISQNVYNPAGLDENEDNYPHIEARNCLNALSMSLPQVCMPIFLSYIQQLSAQMNKEDPIQTEMLLFGFSIIIDGYNQENPPIEAEAYQKMCLECVQCVQQCCENAATTHPRVLKVALHLLLCLIDNTPELVDFSPFCPFLVAILSDAQSHKSFCDDAKDLLIGIVQLPTLSVDPAEIFNQLISFENVYALESALEIFRSRFSNAEEEASKQFALLFLPKLVALTEIILSPEANESGQIDLTACTQLLPLVINIMVHMIDMLQSEAIPYLGKLSPMMNVALENFEHPEALKAICVIAFITKQNVPYAITQVHNRLKNNSGTDMEDDDSIDTMMRYAAISSITLYLSKCPDIAPILHEILHTLFELLKEHLVGFRNNDLEVATIEAINSLHVHLAEHIKPFIPQLIEITPICLRLLETVEDDDFTGDIRLKMISVIMEEIRLVIMNGGLEIAGPDILQMATNIIQAAVDSSSMDTECLHELTLLLVEMFNTVPDQTREYYSSNGPLQEMITQANEQEEYRPLLAPLTPFLQ